MAILEFRLARTEWQYKRLFAERKKAGKLDPSEEQNLLQQWTFDTEYLGEEIDDLFARSLVGEARRLRVAIPPKPNNRGGNESWAYQEMTRTWCLTHEGTLRLRASIRAEKKEQRDAILAWAPLVSTTTGLVGTVTALVLALTRR